MTTPLQPLTLSELLDRTFQLYRRHFIVMVTIVALPHLLVLAMGLTQQLTFGQGLRSRPGDLPDLGLLFLYLPIALLVQLICTSIAQGATVVAVARLYLGKTTTVTEAFGGLRGCVLLLIGLSLVLGILIGFGFVLLVVPGVILMLIWAFVPQVTVVERRSFGGVMTRSTNLTSGIRGRLFAIYLLFFVLNMVFSALWEIPIVIAGLVAGAAGRPLPMWAAVLSPIGAFITQCLAGPLLNIAMTMAYYDARVKKEGFDLDLLTMQLAGEPAAGALP